MRLTFEFEWLFGGDFRKPQDLPIWWQIESEAKLNAIGRAMVYFRLKNILENRLRIQAWFSKHPEIEQQNVGQVVFVTGLARSGTTTLHRYGLETGWWNEIDILGKDWEFYWCSIQLRLLAQDNVSFHHFSSWETMNPAPMLQAASEQIEHIIRKREAYAAASFMEFIAPDFSAIHPVQVDAPEEEVTHASYRYWRN